MLFRSHLLGRQTFTAALLVALAACSSDEDSGDGGGTPDAASKCGNGVVDEGEKCDKTVPSGQTCDTATAGTRPSGTLACSDTCGFNTLGCTSGSSTGGTGGSGGGGGMGGSGGVAGSGGTGGAAGAGAEGGVAGAAGAGTGGKGKGGQ